MSVPSATAGDSHRTSLPSSSSISPNITRSKMPRTDSSRTEIKPSTGLTYNHERLEATGVKPLEAPGENSNYHHWQFVMGTIIRGSAYGYVLRDVQPDPLPSTEEHDRCKVSALLLRYVDQANYEFLSPHQDDPKIWFHVIKPNSTLKPRARSAIFLSYLINNEGAIVWDTEKKCALKATSLVFLDKVFPRLQSENSPMPKDINILPWPTLDSEEITLTDKNIQVSEEELPTTTIPSRPIRARRQPV
ncbi:uncharacterized protein MELLADRAFT_112187 [Melampsora larici-populina 98AG31]|uniref:Uncharacterized protein n=1 Tax=Melampsora larici-populina (strain 98AG31 / pathotype 3-4-7) TaxID=747676 RepID=F4S5N3_MELLP|nr:uncharacterized protein MELLADRAFT_112187 [Melampsora larici-populina 98AG31]EGG00058.1 hypothetical protein MELLADRAFT_112187 [Melampsora larici-populina 98AG31]